jgi:hypothetical protein
VYLRLLTTQKRKLVSKLRFRDARAFFASRTTMFVDHFFEMIMSSECMLMVKVFQLHTRNMRHMWSIVFMLARDRTLESDLSYL